MRSRWKLRTYNTTILAYSKFLVLRTKNMLSRSSVKKLLSVELCISERVNFLEILVVQLKIGGQNLITRLIHGIETNLTSIHI